MTRAARILALLAFLFAAGIPAAAQFKQEAFSQSYNDDPASPKDTADRMFSFREFFGAVTHRNTMKVGTMLAGSSVFIGTGQIYNRDYWKLPLVYGGIGGGLASGFYFRNNGKPDIARWCFIGAGVSYWATMMDEVFCYKPDDYPQPGKATIYSILLPGLGQIYNGEAWKLPIYWGGLVGSVHFFVLNRTNYQRYRRIYLEATDESEEYKGPVSAQTALYYRNVYRRYRDYSVLAIAGFYLLQVIDANVFAYMHDFNVAEDLTLSVDPAVIPQDNCYALGPGGGTAFGLRLGLTF